MHEITFGLAQWNSILKYSSGCPSCRGFLRAAWLCVSVCVVTTCVVCVLCMSVCVVFTRAVCVLCVSVCVVFTRAVCALCVSVCVVTTLVVCVLCVAVCVITTRVVCVLLSFVCPCVRVCSHDSCLCKRTQMRPLENLKLG